MELRINDYVRTKRNGIGKIISFSYNEDNECCFIELANRRTGIKECNIIKSSPQIIDLIEKNDLLKIEYRVLPDAIQTEIVQVIENKDKKLFVHLWTGDYFIEDISKNGMIKQILTHEQFESEAYRVEE